MSRPAPTKHITLKAIAEVPDDKGRFRFTIENNDYLAKQLRKWTKSGNDHLPYRASANSTIFWATPLGKKTVDVLRREVERLRGLHVEVTVVPKRYAFYPEGDDTVSHGIALTLLTILEVTSPDTKYTSDTKYFDTNYTPKNNVGGK